MKARLDEVSLPNGRTAPREICEHLGGVGVLPIDREGNVILVRQFRYAFDAELLEIPPTRAVSFAELDRTVRDAVAKAPPLHALSGALKGAAPNALLAALAEKLKGGDAAFSELKWVASSMPAALTGALYLAARGIAK